MRLTGRMVASVSNASVRWHYSTENGWPLSLLEKLGLSELKVKRRIVQAYISAFPPLIHGLKVRGCVLWVGMVDDYSHIKKEPPGLLS